MSEKKFCSQTLFWLRAMTWGSDSQAIDDKLTYD